MNRLEPIIEQITLALMTLQQKEESGLEFHEFFFTKILNVLSELVLDSEIHNDFTLLKSAIMFLQQVEIGSLEVESILPTNSSRLPGFESLRSNLASGIQAVMRSSSLSTLGYFAQKASYPSFKLWGSKSANSVSQPQEFEMQSLKISSSESDEVFEDGIPLQSLNQDPPKGKTFGDYLRQHSIELMAYNVPSALFDKIPKLSSPTGITEYLSQDELKILKSIYQSIRYYIPTWTHVFEKDSDGIIEKNKIYDWYRNSQNSALKDFTRDIKILNTSGGTEEDCVWRILSLVEKTNYPLEEKAIIATWLAQKGGQDNNLDMNNLNSLLPINGGAKLINSNWIVEEGKIRLLNSLHINLCLKIENNNVLYTMMRFDGMPATLTAEECANEREKYHAAKRSVPPMLLFEYKIQLDIEGGSVKPHLIEAKLHSYTDHIQLLNNEIVSSDELSQEAAVKLADGELQNSLDDFEFISSSPRL